MEILYFGFMSDETIYEKNIKKKNPYFIAQYMYEQALCSELDNLDNINIDYVNIYQTNYWPNDKLINKSNKNGIYKMLSFINIPFIREISYFISSLIRLTMWYFKTINNKEKLILSSTHFTPVSAAICLFSRISKIKKIVTFTDLSLFTYQSDRIKNMKIYKRLIIKPYIKLTNYLQDNYDGYILFSKAMLEIVNLKLKPYIVIEGIFNNINIDINTSFNKKNAIAHAGTLSYLVGINNILDTFNKIKLDTKLWIMGSGDMCDEIIMRKQKDSRIEFFGFIPKNEVFKKLQEARLLIILRNINDEYTKYSFPSKILEYMVSGTPVVTTRLEGIPDDYYPYLYLLDTTDPQTCANKISEILTKSDEELSDFGNKARTYILENKNAKKQALKVLSLLYKCLEYDG